MNELEILILPLILLIVFMLLCQTMSTRIVFFDDITITVEYFPFKLWLYNFKNQKISKRKLKKTFKRLHFFQNSILKSATFLFKRTKITVFDLNLPATRSKEPHDFFIRNRLSALSKIYLITLLYSLSDTDKDAFNTFLSEKSSDLKMDVSFTIRVYNLVLAYVILVFSAIKRRGIKKIVR